MYVRRGMGDATGGAVSAGVQLATNAAALWLNSIQVSHQANTATTQIVNGLEPLLNANKNAYLAGPGTCADQAAALAAFDTAIRWLRSPQACGNGAFGSAGNRCIADRIGSGAQWPWEKWYRDPIANDPRAAACAASLLASNPRAAEQSAIDNLLSVSQGSNSQTTAGLYAGASSGSGASGGGAAATDAGFSFSTNFLGLPVWVWAGGLIGLVIALK